MNPIYLDHNATTPVLPDIIDAMAECWRAGLGNPASAHEFGRRARRVLEEAREAIGKMLGAEMSGHAADRVIFTSGGTEANNLAVLGSLSSAKQQSDSQAHKDTAGQASSGTHLLHQPPTTNHQPLSSPTTLLTSAIEHPSILRLDEAIARRNARVERIPVDARGVVRVDRLEAMLQPNVRLVSVMLVNNETGVIQPVKEIAALCQARRILLHTDAVQAVGKIPVHFRELGVALMTVAAHKSHGPIGIGALIVRAGIELEPLLVGGFQQAGLRPGSEGVPLAVGMRAALAAWQAGENSESGNWGARLRELRDSLETAILAEHPTAVVIGRDAERAPHTLCISFPGLDRQALVMALDQAGVACSSGSACASGSSEPSITLTAMGLDRGVIDGAIRLSVGVEQSAAEMLEAARRISKTANELYRQKESRKSPPTAPRPTAKTL